jgi:hypothetical protein
MKDKQEFINNFQELISLCESSEEVYMAILLFPKLALDFLGVRSYSNHSCTPYALPPIPFISVKGE